MHKGTWHLQRHLRLVRSSAPKHPPGGVSGSSATAPHPVCPAFGVCAVRVAELLGLPLRWGVQVLLCPGLGFRLGDILPGVRRRVHGCHREIENPKEAPGAT